MGHCNLPEYSVWGNMIQRCNNPKNTAYHNYGGRGIKVCDSWRKFNAFYYDMGSRPSNDYTIERIDNNAGYCKENCKWATRREQARNKRTNFNITFHGRTQCLTDWAAEKGMRDLMIYYRLKILKWSVDDALTFSSHERPMDPPKSQKLFTCFGKTMNITQWSKEIDLHVGTIRRRLRRGFTFEDAITNIPSYFRSSNRLLVFKGETLPLCEWSRRTGISEACISRRLDKQGLSVDQALSLPIAGNSGKFSTGISLSSQHPCSVDGRTMTICEWAREYGVSWRTIHFRIKSGMGIKEALTEVSNQKA